MKLLLTLMFALTLTLGTYVPGANSLYEEGLAVDEPEIVQQDVKVNEPEEPSAPTYRERLEQQVSRGEIRAIHMECTAYTHTGDNTYTGIYPYVGVVAVDPNVIPLHSKVYVEGYGEAIAEDTGGLIIGRRMDLFMDSEAECDEWGRQIRKVYIIRERS